MCEKSADIRRLVEWWLGGFSTGGLLGICLMALFMWIGGDTSSQWEAKAIQHNAAHYHPKTGKFTWNDEKGTE